MSPDAEGNFKGIAVPPAGWLRVFGPLTTDPDDVEIDVEEPDVEIEWSPDWSLDGAHFTPE